MNNMEKLYLRKANNDDKEILFIWVNDRKCRENSFTKEVIRWEQHEAWFDEVTHSESVWIYIVMIENKAIGQVRLEVESGRGIISYSLAKEYRGFGLGKYVIQLLENKVLSEVQRCDEIYAEVRSNNIASQRVFEELDYVSMAIDNYIVYIKKKTDILKEKRGFGNEMTVNLTGGGTIFLTNNKNSLKLYDWLCEQGELIRLYSEQIDCEVVSSVKPQYIISYNYSHIIDEKTIDFIQGRIFNLHISYLPWNKGSNPNFWSFVEDTPKGVTIHRIDKGLDTGDVLIQKQVYFDESKETFRSTYEYLNAEIIRLLEENWCDLKNGRIAGVPQIEEGSAHTLKEFNAFLNGSNIQWDENILDFKRRMELYKEE